MARGSKRATVGAGPVEGPWELPEGWRWERLGDLGEWYGGGTPSKAYPDFWTDGTVPWVSAKDMKSAFIDDTDDHITDAAVQGSSAKRIPAGSVLCVMRSGILRRSFPVAVTLREVTINQDLRALKPREDINPLFVAHFLKRTELDVLHECSKDGTTVDSIDTGRLMARPVPLPNRDVQDHLVARVGELFAEIADGEHALAAASERIATYRQSLLKAAVTGDLTTEWRRSNPGSFPGSVAAQRVLTARRAFAVDLGVRKYVEPAKIDADLLGDLPDGWCWMSLDEVSSPEERSFQSGPFGSSLLHSEFQNAGKLVIGIDNVRDGYFSRGSNHRISEEKFDELRRYSARPRDLLITVMATIGRVCVVPDGIEDAIITKHLYRISCFGGAIDPDFLSLAMRGRSETLSEIFGKAQGQTRPGLNKTILQQVPIPVPPLAEQREILARFSVLQADTDGASAGVDSLHAASSRLRQSILAAAFRGDLVA